MKASRAATVLLVVGAFVVGVSIPAFAAKAYSSTYRFFGPTDVGGHTQCANQKAYVDNGIDAAWGHVIAYFGANCDNPNQRPAGNLGTEQTLWNFSSNPDYLCEFSDFYYNSGPAVSLDVSVSWSPKTFCPANAAYYSESRGIYWVSDIQQYRESSKYSHSPNLNLP